MPGCITIAQNGCYITQRHVRSTIYLHAAKSSCNIFKYEFVPHERQITVDEIQKNYLAEMTCHECCIISDDRWGRVTTALRNDILDVILKFELPYMLPDAPHCGQTIWGVKFQAMLSKWIGIGQGRKIRFCNLSHAFRCMNHRLFASVHSFLVSSEDS